MLCAFHEGGLSPCFRVSLSTGLGAEVVLFAWQNFVLLQKRWCVEYWGWEVGRCEQQAVSNGLCLAELLVSGYGAQLGASSRAHSCNHRAAAPLCPSTELEGTAAPLCSSRFPKQENA